MVKIVTVRVEDEVHAALEELARSQGVTMSDFVRNQLARALGPDQRTERETWAENTPPSMTTYERRSLALQHRILARLVAGDADQDVMGPGGEDGDYRYQMDRAVALEKGWVEEYATEFAGVDREMPREETELVHDILEMFMALERSYDTLERQAVDGMGIERWNVEFAGFDLSKPREARMLGFAQHLIVQGRWEPMAKYFTADRDQGNSHAPFLDSYVRMLAAFKPIWREKVRAMRFGPGAFDLTVDEIRTVTEAGHFRS